MEGSMVGRGKSVSLSVVLVGWLLASTVGCASTPTTKEKIKLAGLSDFGLMLVKAGIPLEEVPDVEELTEKQVEDLNLKLQMVPQTMQNYTFRTAVQRMLRAVKLTHRPIKMEKLSEWLRGYDGRAFMRPDGYLAYVLTGKEAECVGRPEVKNGALMAGPYEVGNLYAKGLGGWQSMEIPMFQKDNPWF